MAVMTLMEKADELRSSSKFTGGDRLSFKIPLSDSVVLPGSHDPAAWLDNLGLKDMSGMSVAVVCPDNGGVVAEAVRRGACMVFACEPRYFYHQSLPEVISLIEKPEGVKVAYTTEWPGGYEGVDLVLWPDGLQETRSPRTILKKVFSMLNDGGVVYIEAVIGGHGKAATTTNSWKPTEDALKATLAEEAPDAALERIGPGRFTNRVIYRIAEPQVVIEALDAIEDVKPPKKTKKKRKKRATKKAKQVMNLTGLSLEEVHAEVELWGAGWLDKIIEDHANDEKGVKVPPRLRGTTSDKIGFNPIKEKP